jgi:hypothetical protein
VLQLLNPRVDQIERMHVYVKGLLLRGELEPLLRQPLSPSDALSQDKPFAGTFAVKPDTLIQVMPAAR